MGFSSPFWIICVCLLSTRGSDSLLWSRGDNEWQSNSSVQKKYERPSRGWVHRHYLCVLLTIIPLFSHEIGSEKCSHLLWRFKHRFPFSGMIMPLCCCTSLLSSHWWWYGRTLVSSPGSLVHISLHDDIAWLWWSTWEWLWVTRNTSSILRNVLHPIFRLRRNKKKYKKRKWTPSIILSPQIIMVNIQVYVLLAFPPEHCF